MLLNSPSFRSNPDHDRLVAIALVRISPSCKKATTELEWRVTFGGGKKEGKATIKVDLEADTSDMSFSAKEPKALAFKPAYPGKAIAVGSPVVVDLEVSLEPGSLAPVMVEIKNKDAGNKFPYDMCLGGVWFRGRNYPCFSPVQVESNFSTSGTSGNRNDSAVYNLGLVCNTFVDSRDEENKVTIRVAMRPPDDGTLKIKESFNVEGYATVGSHSKKIDTVKFTIAREPEQVETSVNATVKLVNPDPIPIRIHQRLWIPFNITIPIDAVVKVEVESRAPYKNNRAIMTVHNMRLVSGGINIPCPMLYPQPKVVFNPTGPTTQSDVIRGYIGYFTNLENFLTSQNLPRPDQEIKHSVYIETNSRPVTAKARRLAPDRLRIAKAEFENMITLGHMRPSKSNYASPLHMVPKKDSTEWRPVGDYRALNAQTIKDNYSVPNILDFTSNLHGTKIYSHIDLVKAYHQILNPDDVHKSAIITPFKLFESTRMQFGLCNAAYISTIHR
ncbi:uncharacterized protein TNCV_3847481 [Trichonephila clavipes]|nr:uncharacterized protein TNCV_3847481 [Trichonephila clavipes]